MVRSLSVPEAGSATGDPSRFGSAADLDALEALLPRYVGPGPRYTSYPTVPAWQTDFDRSDHERALRSVARQDEISLYAHIPFCASLCHFCACNRVITRDAELPKRLLRAISKELDLVCAHIERRPRARQIHWGGGTPTHLTPDQIEQLFGMLSDRFEPTQEAEISIEVDPRVTTLDHLDALARCGFNRISMGIQDTNAKTQAAIHRIQPFEQSRTLTDAARERGIERVNYDLIYGLPHQTVETFGATLDDVLSARPDRIALYGYAHVTWVAKQQRGFERGDLPDPQRRLAIFSSALRRLLDAGYRSIGMDHFALPEDELSLALDEGTLRRNFMGYTTAEGVDVLAFGPSAISELEGAYVQGEKDLDPWTQELEAGRLPTFKGHWLSQDDRARRFIISRIMCEGGVSAKEVERRFGGDFRSDYAAALDKLSTLQEDGLVEIAPNGDIAVLALGRFLLRHVAMAFDAYLDPVGDGASKTFSQTV
ncbi:MAG: oxygen-independent coproporphyrinogen III oxidase [Deltaproteobacteria bacterium]|nr:oxygen-independent coproporphyrinogen III oxidase [Deltaproteobacteria bacterium]